MTAIEMFLMREKLIIGSLTEEQRMMIVSEIATLICSNSSDDYILNENIRAHQIAARLGSKNDPFSDNSISSLCEDAHNYAVEHADDLSSTIMQLEEKVNRGIPIEKEYREILYHHSSDEALPMLLEWAGKYGFSLPKDDDTPEKDKRNPFSLFSKWFSETIDLEELHRNECRLAYCKALLKRGIEKQKEEQESHTVTPMPKHIRTEFEKYPNDITIGEVDGKEVAFSRVFITQSSLVKNEILNDDILKKYLYNPKKNEPYSAPTLKALDKNASRKKKTNP